MTVNWNLYQDCKGTSPDSTDHTCAVVTYQNEDGGCTHFACEGEHTDCGTIISVEPIA